MKSIRQINKRCKPLQITAALTADAFPETNNKALEARMVDYFTKTLYSDQLYCKLLVYDLKQRPLNKDC